MQNKLRRRGVVALGLAGLLAGVTACGGGDSDNEGGSGEGGGDSGASGTLVFGASADPVSMDGAYVSDGESLRVVRQLFETLVTDRAGRHRDRAGASPRSGSRPTTARSGRSRCRTA
jgi:peptide/nickel transport system substrate-binding protein